MIHRTHSVARFGGAVLSTLLALFVLTMFSAGAAFGQGGGPPETIQEKGEGTWHSDVLRIKVTPSAADAAEPATENGVGVLGIASVDELNADYGAVSVEPLFDVGGEYEDRQRDHGLHQWYEIRFEEGAVATDATVEEASAEYGALSDVLVAEGDARAEYHVTENPEPPIRSLLDPLSGTPDDPLYDDQYGFQNIEAEGGWQTTTGDTSVVVSVHDSGITGNFDGEETTIDHPDLEPNVWYGGDPNDGSVHGKNFAGDPANLVDNTNGHGTHVTGTMAAVTNNALGVAGTAGGNGEFANGRGDGIRYMVIPNLNEPDAYVYAADNGAVISQNSWGFISPGVFPQATQDAIDYFIENGGGDQLDGGIVVFSAGNDGADIQAYPAFYPPTVAVASTNENDNVSGFSNFGDWVDIAAPGTSILSTWLTGQGSVEDNYEFLSGTSMSAPHVSGAAALVVAEFPDITSPDQVETKLEEAADDIDASVDIGAGRLNLAQALQEDDGQPPEAITDLSVTDVAAAQVDLQWTVPEGSPAVYDIRYSTDPIENDSDFENAQQVEDPPTPSAPGETDEATVGGLSPDTEYFFAIKSSDTFGNTSDLSNVPSATTENAPAIALDPEEQSLTLNVGETGENSFSILNAGKDTLEYTLEPVLGGTQISDPIGEPTTLASEADFPEGNYETAIGSAPEDGEPVANTAPVQKLNADLEGSTYFGVNSGDATDFVSFEGSTPETLNILSSYPASDPFSNAGDFPRDDDSFVYELDNEGNLRTVDVETGDFEQIGNVGAPGNGWTGMSTDPTSGTIYVNTGTSLYTLDPDAPSVEEIGSFGVDFMIDIAVDGEGQMYGYSLTTDAFYEINKETGEATQVGSIGFDANFGQGLTWDTQNQVMLMAAFNNTAFQGELRTVNRETGSTELIGVLGENSPGGTNQLGWIATPISATGEWLAAEPTEGEVPEDEPDEITLSYQTTFEEEGVLDLTGGLSYFADVEIQSNDPSTPTEQLPVTLTVNGEPAVSVSEDPLDFGEVFTGTTRSDTLTVFNDSDNNILQVGSLQLEGSGVFSLPDSSGFVLDPGESMAVPVTFSPTESTTYESTLSFASSAGDQEVGLLGQGAPFVSISPDSLSQTIDLTTGDSTASQEFTVTNEFSESLPFSVIVEALEGEEMDLTPKLADQELRRWRQLQKAEPMSNPGVEPSLQPVPEGGTEGNDGGRSAAARLASGPEVLDETGVTAYGNEVLEPEIVSFDAGVPGDFTIVDEGVDSFAGNFTFANNEEIYWIDNEDNNLKTYVLEDGSVETIGELEPVGSDVTWSDMETAPDGTTYVTAGEGNTNRLYELDVDDAELDLVGEYASGDLVVALAIDGDGNAYAHEIVNDEILSVDLETAESEVIGSTGIDANFAQSMTYDGETGQILMAALHNCGFFGCGDGTLRQVDRETGNTTLIGSFPDEGGDELGWLATPGTGIPWLSTNLEQGTLPPGVSLTLEAQFDASQIVEGDYSAQISIVGEELQGEPSESLPVNLSVEAAPISFVSKDSLQYEDLFVDDTSSTQMVTLRNDGAANLNVTNVSIDSENFTFSGGTEFTLEPGDARIFDVAFTPQSVGEFTATMTIEGEEISTREVTLVGEGISAPALSLNPTSFEKQAYIGQTQEETVEVTNTGGNPLEYDLSVLPSEPPVEQLLIEQDFDGSEFPPGDWFRAGANDGENWTTPEESFCSIWVDPGSACFLWSPSTEGTQRLITPQLNTEEIGQVFVQFTHLIDNFGEPDDFNVRLETTGDGGETWTTVKEFPAETVGPIDEMIAIENEDVGSDEFHVAWTFEGDSFNINTWGVDDVQVFAGGEWLAVDKTSGTVAPSESDTLNLTVDTNVPGIEENTYESGLGFVTNAPLAETAELPFTLDVVEEVTMTMDTGGEDHNPNEEFTMDFNVESLDDLEVNSYEMTMNFPADSMQIQNLVTEGTLSEDITLSSNIDNETGTLTVSAFDAGTDSEPGDGGGGAGLFDIEGQGTLISANVKMAPVSGNPKLGSMRMDMEQMVFNEGNPPASAPNHSMEVVPLYGDADVNLTINVSDALDVLDFSVGNIDFFPVQETHGDVSGNGDVSAFDASLIVQKTIGAISCFPVVDGCEDGNALASKSSDASNKSNASFAWGEISQPKQETGKEESSVLKLPLALNQTGQGVYSLEVTTELDADIVSVKDVEAQLPDSWKSTHRTSDDGTLKIAMAGATPLTAAGKVATLTLNREGSDATAEIGGNVTVNGETSTELSAKSLASIPEEFALEGTYPNPFRRSATLKMDLPKKANVTVEVYDLLGRKVQTAHNGEIAAGTGRTVRINGSDLSSGTYFYRARVEMGDTQKVKSGKMTLVR